MATVPPSPEGSQSSLCVSVPEAARLLGISKTVAYELVAAGELRSVRIRRRVLVPRAALEEFVGSGNPSP